ncbi:hypothetical protein CB0940_08436 [Cercospora beticola]|uniref:Uncharacterized protein n=1 Tax=Cercospora beticola TaxID=122368 RepID=A0A2G5HP55_CERBT|nr:hypothetical protein CB0940_08436 [Cercospora beticola]PIA94320.1 hypothetical protein CB0940_08436 [Cercospora beticola]WPB05012.1 hypothetical protein RHO25_009660 [Cercospora beticola]
MRSLLEGLGSSVVLPCTLILGRIVQYSGEQKRASDSALLEKWDVILCSLERWQGGAYTICRVLSVEQVQRAVWEEQASCLHLCPPACMNIHESILIGSAEDGSALLPQPPIEFHRKSADIVVELDRRNDPLYTLRTSVVNIRYTKDFLLTYKSE